jgi:prevent-host-death family protein
MDQYNIAEAKARLSELVARAADGEDVIIARDNKPMVRLIPVALKRGGVRIGALKGKVWIADDFDEPIDPFNLPMATKR